MSPATVTHDLYIEEEEHKIVRKYEVHWFVGKEPNSSPSLKMMKQFLLLMVLIMCEEKCMVVSFFVCVSLVKIVFVNTMQSDFPIVGR